MSIDLKAAEPASEIRIFGRFNATGASDKNRPLPPLPLPNDKGDEYRRWMYKKIANAGIVIAEKSCFLELGKRFRVQKFYYTNER